jgi:two-component sensor histidine kinase
MWSNKLVIAGTGLVTSLGLRPVYRRVARGGSGLAPQAVCAVAASVAGAFVWNAAASSILGRSLQNDSVLLGALGRTLPRFDGVLYHALVLLTWSLLYLGARHYRALVAERERSLRAESLAREARLLALRYQISPHFLFNALNAVSTLVVTDRKGDATTMIARLADLLRVSLEPPTNGLITLRSELEIVRAYVAIEQVRFADRLQVVIDADPRTADALVPAMILQPLVENAVRHAVAVRDEPTRVEVRADLGVIPSEARNLQVPNSGLSVGTMKIPRFARNDRGARNDRLILTVCDDGPGANPTTDGFGVGLANVRARLEELYGDDHTFAAASTVDGGFRAEISLPLTAETLADARDIALEARLA